MTTRAATTERADTAGPGAMPSWASWSHRVDPLGLRGARHFEVGGRRFSLDARGVVEHRADGVAAPLRGGAFDGVAARAMEDASGTVTVTLELMHADASRSVPLLVAHDLDDIAADWREWARLFALPMLMVEADGSVSRLDGAPQSTERRQRASGRPRFLARRRVGSMGVTMRIEGTEIIARR